MTFRELEGLVAWAREGRRRIRVRLGGYKYSIVIGRYIEARDERGRTVSWRTAFGARAPHDVLSSFNIEKVEVEEGGSLKSFKSLDELLRYAGVRS